MDLATRDKVIELLRSEINKTQDTVIGYLEEAKNVQNENEFLESVTNDYKRYLNEIIPKTRCSNVNLSNADLSEVDLSNATLYQADLTGANLSAATLNYTDLQEANLSGANMQETRLYGSDLREANLEGTDLSGAKYNKFTQFPEAFDPNAAGMELIEG